MADKEIAIVIKGKDASGGAFASASAGVKGFRSSIDSADKALGVFGLSMKGVLGPLLGATAIVTAIKGFTDLTGTLTDLSAKTGIGTTALQKLKFMAEQSGGSLEQVTSAITKMGTKLITGEAGTVNALKALGLAIDDVRRMQPDEAFARIGDKIAGIESPMQRAQLATELFGKSGADLLPMMTGHLEEMGQAAEDTGLVLSEDVVAAGDEFGDTLGKLFTAGMALLGKVIGPFLPLLTLLTEGLLKAATAVGNVLGPAVEILIKIGQDMFDVIVDVVGGLLNFASKIPGVSSVVSGLRSGFEALKAGAADLHTRIVGVDKGTAGAAASMGKLKLELPPTTASIKEAAAATKALSKEAADLVTRVEKEEQAHHKLGLALRKLTLELIETIKAKREDLILTPLLIEQYTSLESRVDTTAAALERLAEIEGQKLAEAQTTARSMIEKASVAIEEQERRARELGNEFVTLGNILDNDFIRSIGGVINVVYQAKDSFKSLKAGIGEMTSGGGLTSILSGLTGIVGGIGGIVSAAQAAIQIGKALFSLFDRDKGRDAVKKFAAEFGGGFDEIQGYMALLGDEGARMWKALTQGKEVHSSPEAAKKIIDEVRAAIEKLKASASSPVTVEVNHVDRFSRIDEGGGGEGGDNPGFDGGTPNLDFMNFGRRSSVDLHREEAVIPKSGVGAFAAQLAAAMGGLLGGGGGTVVVQFGTREVARELMPAFADEIKRLRLA